MRRTLDNRALTRLPYWNCPSGSVRLRRAERHLLSRWLSSGEFAASLRAPELCAWSGQVWERSAGPPSSSGGLIMHAENRALEGCWAFNGSRRRHEIRDYSVALTAGRRATVAEGSGLADAGRVRRRRDGSGPAGTCGVWLAATAEP